MCKYGVASAKGAIITQQCDGNRHVANGRGTSVFEHTRAVQTVPGRALLDVRTTLVDSPFLYSVFFSITAALSPTHSLTLSPTHSLSLSLPRHYRDRPNRGYSRARTFIARTHYIVASPANSGKPHERPKKKKNTAVILYTQSDARHTVFIGFK